MSQGGAAGAAIGTLKTKMSAMKKEIDDLKEDNENLNITIKKQNDEVFRVGMNVLRLSGM